VDIKQIQNRRRPEPPPARGSQRARTVDFANPALSTNPPATQKPGARKMIAPLYPGHAQQIIGSEGSRDALNDLRRSDSGASTHSLPSLPYRASNTLPQNQSSSNSSKPQVLRKPAPPPIPSKKPALLTKASSSHISPAPPPQRYRDDPPMEESRAYPPPPAKRSMAPPPNLARKPIQNLIDGDDDKPALPPRINTNGSGRGGGGGRSLMDDEPEDMQNMRDWEVLRPVR
jgi:inositol-1,4,5-trisphosphate 5-phosphatase